MVELVVLKIWYLARSFRGLRMFALVPQRFPSDGSGDIATYDSAAMEHVLLNPHSVILKMTH